jgi:hypothetical protein
MPGFLSSLPFFALLSIGNYYVKNTHPQTTSDPAYRMPEFSAEQIPIVLSQRTLHIYIESA